MGPLRDAKMPHNCAWDFMLGGMRGKWWDRDYIEYRT